MSQAMTFFSATPLSAVGGQLIYECRRCCALVSEKRREDHWAWHKSVDSGVTPNWLGDRDA